MNLYEIDRALQDVLDGGMIVDMESGEVLFDSDNLDALEGELDTKMEGCGVYLKGLIADAEALANEEKSLHTRRIIAEKKAERMKKYIRDVLTDRYDGKFETPKVGLSLRKSSKVVVDNQGLVPIGYLKMKQTIEVDKTAVKKALQNGEEIPGVSLEVNQNVRVV